MNKCIEIKLTMSIYQNNKNTLNTSQKIQPILIIYSTKLYNGIDSIKKIKLLFINLENIMKLNLQKKKIYTKNIQPHDTGIIQNLYFNSYYKYVFLYSL